MNRIHTSVLLVATIVALVTPNAPAFDGLDGKSASPPAGEYPLSLADIRARDPFILADRESQTYYLYAQGGNRALNDDADLGVEVYRTYVNEGEFLHRMKNGTLVMIWSSFVSAKGKKGYAIGQAVSESGTVAGPWRHVETPLFGGQAEDGGHAMILRDFSGNLLLVFHQPNIDPDDLKPERAQILRIKEAGNKLVMDGRWTPKADATSGN